MNKYNTVLGQMLELISRSGFEKLVKEHKIEYKAKGLKSWTQFVSMLFGQVSGQHGLRSIEKGMNSQKSALYHLGINNDIKRSTLSYANNNRDSILYEKLFENVLGEAQKIKEPHGFRFNNPLSSIDSTVIDLCLKLFPWAEFRKGKGGIKLNIKLDHQGKIPSFVNVSNARQHDVKAIRNMPVLAGDVLVFDRGFTDYSYFQELCDKKAYFVTRMKKNAVYKLKKKREVKAGGNIISDYEIVLPKMSGSQKLRKIIARDPQTNNRITIITNNLSWSSSTIAAVYKARWQIELFFKAIKQNLKIKRFYGNSKNAVMTQIWIALIAYLLYYLLKMKSKNVLLSFTNFISVIKTMLFQRVPLFEWLCETRPPPISKQALTVNLEFVW